MLIRWIVLLSVFMGAARAVAAGVFDVAGKPPDRVWITLGGPVPEGFTPRSEMLDQLVGVRASLDLSEIKALRLAAIGQGVKQEDPPEGAPLTFLACCWSGTDSKLVEIRRGPDGGFFAKDRAAPKVRGVRLSTERFQQIASSWSRYAGAYKRPEDVRAGQVLDLTPPVEPAWYTFDQAFLGARFNGGRSSQVPAAVRDLSKETFRFRLPRKYDAKGAAGVVVWLWPADNGDIYEPLHAVLDDLGLIAVCPRNVPNSRPVADRYQLALDALDAMRTRYLIDPRRVYVAGLSGGGQISTHLWACMPDVFTGAVPIAALASYKNVDVGGGKMWQGTIGRPVPALFKQLGGHRCAAVTGDKDFNHGVVLEVSKIWLADKTDLRVFDYPGLGHEVPKAEQFAEALLWVDEPYRLARAEEVSAAKALLATPNVLPEQLISVTHTAPWSAPAWEAAAKLGVQPPP